MMSHEIAATNAPAFRAFARLPSMSSANEKICQLKTDIFYLRPAQFLTGFQNLSGRKSQKLWPRFEAGKRFLQ